MTRAICGLTAFLAVTIAATACAGVGLAARASNDSLASGQRRGSLVGAIRLAGGPVSAVGTKLGGRVSVLNGQGRVIVQTRIRRGQNFEFRLPAGRYRLGLGKHPRQDRLGGCRPAKVTIRAGQTTHKNLWFGCAYY